jgi:hypothetical protein
MSAIFMISALLILLVVGLATGFAWGRSAGERKAAVSAAPKLIEKFQEGYAAGYKNGCEVGAAVPAERLLATYRDGFNDGHTAGEDAGVASIEVLEDQEISVVNGFWHTERSTTDTFIVVAGCRHRRVVRGSATLMNKSQDEIAKRISQIQKAAAAAVGIATGHPGVAAAVAAIPQPDLRDVTVNNN